MHVVGIAKDMETISDLAVEALEEGGFRIVDAAEPELVRNRKAYGHISAELEELATAVNATYPIAFGNFHSWGN